MVGERGIEPPSPVPKTGARPSSYSPKLWGPRRESNSVNASHNRAPYHWATETAGGVSGNRTRVFPVTGGCPFHWTMTPYKL